MESKEINFDHTSKDSKEDIKKILLQYLRHWKWFVLCVLLTLAAAKIYIRYATPSYAASLKVILLQEMNPMSQMGSLGAFMMHVPTATLGDQIAVLESREMMTRVVSNNQLFISYYSGDARVKQTALFGKECPFRVIVHLTDSLGSYPTGNLEVSVLSEAELSLKEVGTDNAMTVRFNERFPYKTGAQLEFVWNSSSPEVTKGSTYEVRLSSVDAVARSFARRVVVESKSNNSGLMHLYFTDVHPQRAEFVLQKLIEEYDEMATGFKLHSTRSTAAFINNRLATVSQEIAQVDQQLSNFKSNNSFLDLAAQAGLETQKQVESEKQVVELQTQRQLLGYMEDYLSNSAVNELIPSNIGLQDVAIEQSISMHNALVVERNDLIKAGATTENPTVQSLTEKINSARQNIGRAFGNYRKVVQTKLDNASRVDQSQRSKINVIPQQERGLVEIMRRQKVVEALYLLLLEKREESEIMAGATPRNIQIIDSAVGSAYQTDPNSKTIYVAAIFVGLGLPFAVLFLIFFLDTKVRAREDVQAHLDAAFLGDIPRSDDLMIRDNDRSPLAEAFRILRTNISFMLANKQGSSVIFVTSTISGEGKSFVSANLARILSMSNKKVLLIGADIRNPKVLDSLGLSELQHTNIGITQYMINPDMPIEHIIIKNPGPYKFDVVYSGFVAPNPAELLMSGSFGHIMDYGRAHYDYVIVDTAPVGLVTDTLLISDYADLTLYVVRSEYLDRDMLKIPADLFAQRKLKNLGVVLNDVDFEKGYGYGYGYGYGHIEDKHTWKRWFSFQRKKKEDW